MRFYLSCLLSVGGVPPSSSLCNKGSSRATGYCACVGTGTNKMNQKQSVYIILCDTRTSAWEYGPERTQA